MAQLLKVRGHKAKFGILAGVTPIIDKYHAFNQSLGERFLKFRIRYGDRKKLREKARENNSKKKEMRNELSEVVEAYLESLRIPKMDDVILAKEIRSKIEKAADFLATVRSSVPRNGYTKQVDCLPEPEQPCRIIGELEALVKGIAVARGKQRVDNGDYEEITKIVKDSLPSTKLWVIKALVIERCWLTTKQVSDSTRLPFSTVKILLEDLNMLDVVEKLSGSESYLQNDGDKWKLKESVRDMILEIEL